MRPARSASACFASLLALACATPSPSGEPPLLVGPDAKLDGDLPAAAFLCRVEAGEEGFARADTLHCEVPEGAIFVPAIDVSSSAGHQGSMRLADGPGSLRYFGDRYPLSVHAYGYLSEGIEGLDGVRLDANLVVESEVGWESPRGPALPFDLWAVEITARVSLAQIAFDPYTVRAGDGVRFTHAGEETDALEVAPRDQLLRADETLRMILAAPADGAPIRGSVTVGGTPIPFELDRGGALIVGNEGLVPAQGFEPPAPGGDVVRCEVTEAGARCALVTRPGLSVAGTVRVGETSHSLPPDGSPLEVQGTPELARVVVQGGVDGLDLARFGTIEAPLTFEGGVATASLPYALFHLSVSMAEGDRAYFDAQEEHTVSFAAPIDGSYDASQHLSVAFESGRPDVWVAVSAGVAEIAGRLTFIEASGPVTEHEGVTLRPGAWEITSAGLAMPATIEPGTELARCWTTPEAQLLCHRNETTQIESARLRLYLESRERELGLDLRPGESTLTTLTSFLPVTLTIEIALRGGPTATAEARVTQAADLPESAPLLVLAP